MRAAPYLLIALLAALQATVTAYWMKAEATQRFTDVFQAIHGTVPSWTALAFSFGWYWLALPIASLVWLFLAWRQQVRRRNAWTITAVSLIGSLSMMYAMYPLHVMLAPR
jgi:hypothetical protein